MVDTNSIIQNRWKLGKLLGEGACAKVYAASCVDQKQKAVDYEVVIKVIPLGTGKSKAAKEQERIANTLNYEYMLYTALLLDFPYSPKLPPNFYGTDQSVRYLVMERLEMDLVEYSSKNNLSVNQIADIGLEILSGLEWFHKKGYLFIDIKPQNFMIKQGKVKFVDFGLVERWVSHNSSGARISEVREVVGTPAFLSVNVHRGSTPSRNDEIESLGFVLLSLTSSGTLPWSQARSDTECREMKENCDVVDFSSSVGCSEVGEIINKSRSGGYASSPDYTVLAELLRRMKSRKADSVPLLKNKNATSTKRSKLMQDNELTELKTHIQASSDEGITLNNQIQNANVTTTISENKNASSKTLKGRSATTQNNASCIKTISNDTTDYAQNNNTDIVHSKVKPRNGSHVNSIELHDNTQSSTKKSAIVEENKQNYLKDENILNSQIRTTRATKKMSSDRIVGPFSSNDFNRTDDIDLVTESCHEKLFNLSLRIVSGPHKGEIYRIRDYLKPDDNIVKVGRQNVDKNNKSGVIGLANDYEVSENHMRVKLSGIENIQVIDDLSTNGTKVNGKKIASKIWISIDVNSTVTLGETEFKFQ